MPLVGLNPPPSPTVPISHRSDWLWGAKGVINQSGNTVRKFVGLRYSTRFCLILYSVHCVQY